MKPVDGHSLPLMEHFLTLQGEGFHTGSLAYFLRIGGCDVGCHWCDVKESWNAALHPMTSVEEIVQPILSSGVKTVVITGGEPLMWNMGPLTQALKSKEITIHLETSGAYPVTGEFDWVCLSPKKTKAPLPEWYFLANELKVIVFNEHDFSWAEEHALNVTQNAHCYLQPEWSKREAISPKIVRFIEQHPRWRMSLQSHKYIGIP